MRILTVIPIARGISKDTLTYFTKNDISPGSIISIPLRKKTGYGLVMKSKEVKDAKSEIKALSYNLRKIDNIEERPLLSKSFIKSAEEIAEYYASSLGAVLFTLIPNIILESGDALKRNENKTRRKNLDNSFHETALLQSDDEERYAIYKSIIREEFAKGRSVFFCAPTTEDINISKHRLEKGIENYTHTIHANIPRKEMLASWQEILNSQHPVLIIGTGSFLSIPREDIGTIILEKESSRAYKMQSRPFIDIRVAAECIAKHGGKRLILGDIFLRVETLYEEKEQTRTTIYSEIAPLKFRSLTATTCKLINVKGPEDMKKKEFTIFSEELKKLILDAKENNEHTFLFCGRKGLAPITACSDCGTVVLCKNCSAPIVLYGKKSVSGQRNLFVCHHCGERRDAEELCTYCNGWRLNPLGIGIERVIEEIQKLSPTSSLFIMDKDHITTHKQAVKIRESFYNTPGSIMIGTEMALTYLSEKIQNTAIVTLDSFFSIPDFRINEKIFHILLTLRNLSEKIMLVQTRQENVTIFENALRGNLMDFYRDEIADRKLIGYPPFATNIKITLIGEKSEVRKQMENTRELIRPFDLRIYDAWNPGSKLKYTVHGIISLPKGQWVNKDLLLKLRSLPPYYLVKIDPDTLL